MTEQNAHSDMNLYLALELSNKEWKLAFGDGKRVRLVGIPARNQKGLHVEVERAKEKLGLPPSTPVFSCYEAGRDGFWIHRMLKEAGITNLVVDPASIETNRRARRVKTDRLDARKLLSMLMRYWLHGEKTLWSVVRVPSEEAESLRRIHRNEDRIKKERRQHLTRIRSLLVLYGINPRVLPREWAKVKDWKSDALPVEVVLELEQEQARLDLCDEHLSHMQQVRKEHLGATRQPDAESKEKPSVPVGEWTHKLSRFVGVGEQTAWDLSAEFFAWRKFKNRKQVGSAAGLTGSPYSSGDSQRDQGISKAGNARVRHLAIEMAWRWVHFQPDSALTQWFNRRFGHGTRRMRRVGIVALARKLLIALWKYGEFGELPEGARVKA